MKENSKFFFVRSANKAFRQGRYLEAQAFYEKAAETLGAKIVAFNIKLCQIRIGSTTESGTKYIPSKINQKIVETKTIEPKEPLDHLIATKRPIWTSARMPSTNAAVVKGIVSLNGNYEKAGVILIKLFDNENHELSSHKISLGKSEVFGASFKYLSDTSGVYLEIARVSADLEFSRIETAICLFNAPAGCNIEIKHFTIERPYSTPLNIREIGESGEYKSPEEYKVAMIADEFTHNSFQSEFYSFPITPDNWKEVFEKKKPELFLCESAWSGVDSKHRPWKSQVYASINFKKENRSALISILKHCEKEGIPTVFWNKEDPTHHNDKVHDFVKTSYLFDYIFTTAEECVSSYKANTKRDNVYVLPFATNPRLFNPIETTSRSNKMVFAGSWYANYHERCKTMESILDYLTERDYELEIYDRYYESSDILHKWPEKYRSYLREAVPHNKTPKLYKSSIFGINFNTVTRSNTMFARRVFELMSCNTLVISNYSAGVSNMFGDLVVFPDHDPARLNELTLADIEKIRARALHNVLEKHTYKQRWLSILNAIKMPYRDNNTTLTFAIFINNRDQALQAVACYQQYATQFKRSRLLLVVQNETDFTEIAKIYEEFNRLTICVTSLHYWNKYSNSELARLIDTSHVVSFPVSSKVATERIKQAVLHLQYLPSHLIALEDTPSRRYRFGPLSHNNACISTANRFVNLLNEFDHKKFPTAYFV